MKNWMKKMVAGMTLVAAMAMPTAAFADTHVVTMTMDKQSLTVDADTFYHDVAATYDVDGRVIVPVRAIMESLGGTVSYDQATNTVHVDYEDRWADITVGQALTDETRDDAYIGFDGEGRHDIGTFINGRLFIPDYLMAYCLGASYCYVEDKESGVPWRVVLCVR